MNAQEFVEHVAKHGLNADLMPTMNFDVSVGEMYTQVTSYLQHLDTRLRQTAEEVLMRQDKPVVLIVDKTSTDCSNCESNVLDWQNVMVCPTCGETFTHVATAYEDPDYYNVFDKRSDLKRMPYREAWQLYLGE